MKILINILIIIILSINLSLADELQIFDFTEMELADKNIAVNAVTPAGAKTRILDQMTKEHVQRHQV